MPPSRVFRKKEIPLPWGFRRTDPIRPAYGSLPVGRIMFPRREVSGRDACDEAIALAGGVGLVWFDLVDDLPGGHRRGQCVFGSDAGNSDGGQGGAFCVLRRPDPGPQPGAASAHGGRGGAADLPRDAGGVGVCAARRTEPGLVPHAHAGPSGSGGGCFGHCVVIVDHRADAQLFRLVFGTHGRVTAAINSTTGRRVGV